MFKKTRNKQNRSNQQRNQNGKIETGQKIRQSAPTKALTVLHFTHTKRSMLYYCISFWCGCQTLKGDFLMEDLIVKNVDVMGDSIKAAKDAGV